MDAKRVIAKLKASGWVLVSINGSHHMFAKDGKKVPVPVHGSQDLKAGTLSALQRQTGVKLK